MATQKQLEIAVVGAGMGGLSSAAALRKFGIDVHVYEQAESFARVGAGIHVAANAVKALYGLGLAEATLREKAFLPVADFHREYDTGKLTGQLPHTEAQEKAFGAPYTVWHRGDLHAAMFDLVPQEIIHRGRKLVGVDQDAHSATLRFADGSSATADAVIGSDGIHSVVRATVLGVSKTQFTGRLAYRAVIDKAKIGVPDLDPATKWWGPDRHFVHYHVSAGREVAFTTSVPEKDWSVESWSAQGDPDVLRAEFADFHPHVRRILDQVTRVAKWGVNTHAPLPSWCEGRVTIIGDAAHTVTPYMGQGAAQSMEDAVVLARCLAGLGGDADGVGGAFKRFEATRKPRTTMIQEISAANTWGRYGADTTWLYGYDAWTVPLAAQ